jgi:hypothetical protein
MELILCSKCKEEKSKEHFYYKANGTLNGKQCNSCKRLAAIQKYHSSNGVEKVRKYRSENKEKYKEQIRVGNEKRKQRRKVDTIYRDNINSHKKSEIIRHKHRYMWYAAKKRAANKGIEFNIEIDDIVIPEYCPLLNVKLEYGTKDNYLFTPSLDRIDVTKGYIKGNIAVISNLANSMKNCATTEQLFIFIKNLPSYLKDDIV